MRLAARVLAVVAAAFGIAFGAPAHRVERASDDGAGVTAAGERGVAPAVRTGPELGRRHPHPVPLGLPAATASLRTPDVGPIAGWPRRAASTGEARTSARRARAPPPSA